MIFAGAVAVAHAAPYRAREDFRLGAEINVLGPFAPLTPFRAYEFKLRAKAAPGVEAVIGYGRRAGPYAGTRGDDGRLDSHALLLGARAYLFETDANVEYTARLGRDAFHHENGGASSGFAAAHEFQLGYAWYAPDANLYVLPQWSAIFRSPKAYDPPLELFGDRWTLDFSPKASVGVDF